MQMCKLHPNVPLDVTITHEELSTATGQRGPVGTVTNPRFQIQTKTYRCAKCLAIAAGTAK